MELSRHKISLVGLATYLFLACLAVLFYKERVILFDVAFHTFEIIRTKSLAIQGNRFGAAVTQAWPLLAVKINLPLKAVMIVYSLSFVIYPLLIFLISIYLFKSWRIGLCTLLFSVLLTAHTFYWLISEFVQGCLFLFLFYGFLSKFKKAKDVNIVGWVILFVLLITLAFFHPLIAIPFFYLALFFILSNSAISSKLVYFSSLAFILILVLKSQLFPPSSYDAQRMESIKLFKTLFPNYFTLQINKEFLKQCLVNFYFLLPLLLVCIVFYYQKRIYKKLLLLISFFLGFLLLINVTNSTWPETFYLESFYQCLGLFVIVPLVFDILPHVKTPKLAWAGIIILISIRIFHIYFTHKPYSERLAWNENLLKQTEKYQDKKLIIPTGEVPIKLLKLTWSSSYELLLLSSLEDSKAARCMIIDEQPDALRQSNTQKIFISKWGSFLYQDLPQQYFCPQDTSSYKITSLEF